MKNLIILFVMLGLVTTSFAQPQGKKSAEHREKIKEWRMAYITDKLELTEEESIRFWPIYNEREKTLRAITKEKRALRLNDIETMSDKEAEQAIEKHFEFRQRELDVHKSCFGKLKSVIPAKKLARLPRVEREFKKMLLKKMNDRAGGGRAGMQGRDGERPQGKPGGRN